MFSTSTVTTLINGAFTDSGTLLVLVIGGIFGAGVALMGAGYAYRHISRRLLGRKF